MGSSNISKIERVHAPQNARLWVDLCLNKDSGEFFGSVGGERIRSETKADAIKQLKEALNRVSQVGWRAVILIRIDKNRDVEDGEDERNTTENGRPVYGSSCSFTYLRRERAQNPLNPKETIEREHEEDFELRVADTRRHAEYFESTPARKKERADKDEAALRAKRSILADVGDQWTHHLDRNDEYELPYTPEAWVGIRRIAQALRDTQAQLDTFARGATTEKLAALASGGAVLAQLPPASKPEAVVETKKVGRRR